MSQTARIQSSYGNIAGWGLWVTDCAQCGVVFAIPDTMERTRRADSQSFFCPNGHSMIFSKTESIEQRRIEELERALATERERVTSAQRQREWAESRTKGANIAAGKAKASARRLLHRIECGVCPHCQRTLQKACGAHEVEARRPGEKVRPRSTRGAYTRHRSDAGIIRMNDPGDVHQRDAQLSLRLQDASTARRFCITRVTARYGSVKNALSRTTSNDVRLGMVSVGSDQ